MSSASEVLAERAARFHDLVLDVANGPGGMLISFVSYETRRAFQEGEDFHWYLVQNLEGTWGPDSPRPTVAEWYYGENTLWATGWFLWSQILRYRATREPAALATARKCFRDLSNIFRLCRAIEPGLLGKPHGGRAGPTTSYDQAACPVLFYAAYAQELATPEEKAEAVANMALHGDYYLRRDWVMNHHGTLGPIVDPAHTSTMKYLACVHAAHALTGEERFRDAVRRYLRQIVETGRLPWPTNPYETNHNLFYWGLLCDYWSRTELAAEADWIGCVRAYWRAARTAFDEEGLLRYGHCDTASGSFAPYPDRWLTPDDAEAFPEHAPRKSGRRWLSATAQFNRPLNSASAAALALLARSHGIDDDAHRAAERTLLRMDEEFLRWWWDDGRLPEELKPLLDTFAPEVAGVWLVAYWMGRLQQVW
jgi:hypothetical protein